MATLEQKVEAQIKVLQLLALENLPEPDSIEWGEDEIYVKWNDAKVALVVDLKEANARN